MLFNRILILFWLSVPHFFASAEDLIANAPIIDDEASARSAYFVDLANAIGKEYHQGKVTVRQRPFIRSVKEVTQGIADFHLPLICPNSKERTQYFDFLSEQISPVVFALYSSTENPITTEDLRSATYTIKTGSFEGITNVFSAEDLAKLERLNQTFRSKNDLLDAVTARLGRTLSKKEKETALLVAFPYQIETDRLHVDLFDIPTSSAISVVSSLGKISQQRIDGFLYSAISVEAILKTTDLNHEFERSFFSWFEGCVVIGPNLRGSQLDQDLSLAVKRVKALPKYRNLFSIFARNNENWVKKYSKPASH